MFCFQYSISRLSIFNIQRSMFNIQTSIFNIQTSIFRLPYLCYFHYLNNYDLPLYSLFFCKSHVRYCSLPRHNAFLCNEYYLVAEVVQKISNYKQNMLLFNCNRVSYLLVNVGRKRLELHSVAQPTEGSRVSGTPLWAMKLALFNFKQTRNKFRKASHTISRVTILLL